MLLFFSFQPIVSSYFLLISPLTFILFYLSTLFSSLLLHPLSPLHLSSYPAFPLLLPYSPPPTLLSSLPPPLLFLSSTPPSMLSFTCLQDSLQLSHVVQCLVEQRGKGTCLEPELFQYLLLILVSICKAHPHNLLLVSGFVEDAVARQVLLECKEGEASEAPEPEVGGMFNDFHNGTALYFVLSTHQGLFALCCLHTVDSLCCSHIN